VVGEDGSTLAGKARAVHPGRHLPGPGRWLTVSLLTAAAVAIPTAAAGFFGLVVGPDIARHSGAGQLALPTRLGWGVWIAGPAACVVGLGICLGRTVLRRRADDDLLRASMIGLSAAAVLCTLAGLVWPS
jgi:hypothetical protein